MKQSAARKLIITRVRQQARDTHSFDMRPAESETQLSYAPGQIAVLRVDGGRPDFYAFASAPEDRELEFLVKRSHHTKDKPTLYELKEGDAVELIEIVGDGFPLDAHKDRDLVFVAMGTGVAPLRSTLRSALRRPADFGQIVVLYGARTPADFCYRDETETWKAAGIELRQVISKPDGYEWAGSTGYVQSLLDNVMPTLSDPIAFVCGSPEMIAHTRDRLQQMGLAPERILTNY